MREPAAKFLPHQTRREQPGVVAPRDALEATLPPGDYTALVHDAMYIPTSPCAAIEALPDDDKAAKDVFSVRHVRALMDAASATKQRRLIFDAGEDWRGAILFAFYTGASEDRLVARE